ncbi:GAF domain-containing protein [Cyanobacteria bacterium FACHB-DQ100]|nr:GAF domain-containing protein [Cyanobacteria bacterium FACHB-DQ100]
MFKIDSLQRFVPAASADAAEGTAQSSKSSNPLSSRFSPLSFRHQVAAIAIALGMLPTLAVGVVSYRLNDHAVNQAIELQQLSARMTSDAVRYYIKQRQAEISTIATLPMLNDAKVWDSLLPADRAIALDRATQAYSAYSNIVIFDLNGTALLQTQPQIIPNQAQESYFQAALKANRVSVSAATENENQTVLYFSQPIQESTTGKTIAIVRATLPTRNLADLVSIAPQSYSIADGANRFVIASNSNSSALNSFADSRTLQSKFWTNDQTQRRLFLTQAPIAPIEQLPELNWRIILSAPAEQISEPSRLWVLLMSSGTAIASGFIAILLANALTRRISLMKNRVRKLSDGDFSTRLNVKGSDEIAAFGQVIDHMAETIEHSMREQSKNVDQLQQLNQAAFNIRKSIDFDQIVQTGVQEVRYLLNVDRAIVYLFDENWQGSVIAESVAMQFPAALGARIADPCFAEHYVEKYRAGRVHAIPNIAEADLDPCYRGQLEPFEVKANIVAPMVVEGNLIGLLVVHQCSAPRQWQPSEISLFMQIALHLAYAIEQVKLAAEREAAQAQAALAQDRQAQREVLQAQLLELMQQAEQAAHGDLTVRATVSGAEIGTVADFFNTIVESLQRIVKQVKHSALEVNASLSQHEVAVRSLSEDALKQAEETQVTLRCLDQMVRSIHTVAERAKQAAEVSHTAALTAQAGKFAVNQTAESMDELKQSISEAAKKVKRLGESAQQISKAVLLINQIETQTNVLAVNAGIEASRTEEHQGFATIAEEVSALAGRASAATHEISQLVTTIQQETVEMVNAMEKSTAQVLTGSHSVESAKQSLEQIMQVSQQIDQIVQSISEATVSQVSTSDTVSQLMTTIAQVAKHTSSSSLDVSSSLRETVSVAKSLEQSVQMFKVST